MVGNVYLPCLPEILSLKHSNLPGIPKALFFISLQLFFLLVGFWYQANCLKKSNWYLIKNADPHVDTNPPPNWETIVRGWELERKHSNLQEFPKPFFFSSFQLFFVLLVGFWHQANWVENSNWYLIKKRWSARGDRSPLPIEKPGFGAEILRGILKRTPLFGKLQSTNFGWNRVKLVLDASLQREFFLAYFH